MAIYHCSISNVSRSKGSSSCATLSYISADKVYEERTAQTYSYGRTERVLEVGTILPGTAPEEFLNPSILFNAIENYEKGENARTAKKIEVALPRELNITEQKQIVETYIQKNITKEGYACTYAIHNDKSNNNPHAHILIANRQLNDKGEWCNKRKMAYVLDENGQRVPRLDKNGQQKTDKNGRKQWMRVSIEQNLLDKKEFLQKLRESWATECNKYLEPEQQIDHRSYVKQGIEQIPTIHEGYASREIEVRGGVSERCEINREIRKRNQYIKQITEQLKELREKIKEKGAQTVERIRELLQRSRSTRIDTGIGTEHKGQGEASKSGIREEYIDSQIERRKREFEWSHNELERAIKESAQRRLDAERKRKAQEGSRRITRTEPKVERDNKRKSGPSL